MNKTKVPVKAGSGQEFPQIEDFSEPTRIYRFINTRLIGMPPLFMHRNLSYMKGRSTRKNGTKRQSFKLKDLLEKAKSKDENHFPTNKNLVIAFTRFEDPLLKADGDSKKVMVSISLKTILNKRHKTQRKSIGLVSVGFNKDEPEADLPAVCVSNDNFESGRENGGITYQLTFDIEVNSIKRVKKGSEETPSKSQCLQRKYYAELPVLNNSGVNLLPCGVYEVSVNDRHVHCGQHHWKTQEQRIQKWAEEVSKYTTTKEPSNLFDAFDETPKIHLYVEWTSEKLSSSSIARPQFLNDQLNNNNDQELDNNDTESASFKVPDMPKAPRVKPYVYEFVLQNSTQRFNKRTDFICPWCRLNCMQMYALLTHLKLCHSRFLFQLVKAPVQRIEVSLNEGYEGVYSDELFVPRNKPLRRTKMATNILVFRPHTPSYNLLEFRKSRNRVFYRSKATLPIKATELDHDSEDERYPEWFLNTRMQMIDEFTDLNEGEKAIMKMWNLHVLKHGFVGAAQVQLSCEMFLEEKGKELVDRNLTRCFILHLLNLSHFEFLSPIQIDGHIKKLAEIQKAIGNPAVLKLNREEAVAAWLRKREIQKPQN